MTIFSTLRGLSALRDLSYLARDIICPASPFGSVSDAADGLWAQTSRDRRDAAERLADKEAETKVTEPQEDCGLGGDAQTSAAPGPSPAPDAATVYLNLTVSNLNDAGYAARATAEICGSATEDASDWNALADKLYAAATALRTQQ